MLPPIQVILLNFAPKWLLRPALRVFQQLGKKQLIKLKLTTCRFKCHLRIHWEVGDAPKEVLQLQQKINISRLPRRNWLLNQPINNSWWIYSTKAPSCPINMPTFNKISSSSNSKLQKRSKTPRILPNSTRHSKKINLCSLQQLKTLKMQVLCKKRSRLPLQLSLDCLPQAIKWTAYNSLIVVI